MTTGSLQRPPEYVFGQRNDLFQHDAIFLSASVPKDKKGALPEPFTQGDNQRWIDTSDAGLIRDFVSYLCRFTFGRDLNLIFGGHPAITPMVLEAARLFGSSERKHVVVFQSLHYWDQIPKETFQLEDWRLGTPLWTGERPDRENKDLGQSLTHMRKTMVQSPRLLAAIFVGGMDGLYEEQTLWQQHQPYKPCFAIGSTGGAAKDLLKEKQCFGDRADVRTLDLEKSYPMVLSRIFKDIEESAKASTPATYPPGG